MIIKEHASLLAYNTFNINVKADLLVEYDSEDELKALLVSDNVKSKKILAIGGGSNLLFLGDFEGVVLHSRIQFIEKISENDDFVFLEVGSGVVWDDLVAYCVENNWGGIENLSLIPGEVGASAVQNIGAYGVEVKDVIEEVKAITIESGMRVNYSLQDCNYGYRDSIFKKDLKGKCIITSVVFKLQKTPIFQLDYQHLESEVLKRGDVNLKNVRNTIISIRESKLPDTKVQGNAGSFFMNPVVSKGLFIDMQKQYPTMPHYYVSETEEKLPAAWLIDQCGWKGKQLGNAGVHTQQALVLVNRGGASGAEIVHLAEQIQLSVKEKFGVELHAEVNYI